MNTTPHNHAKKNQISKTVFMAGDPKRVEVFVEKYMEQPELVNQVRGEVTYTGFVKGKRVTVMSHGMGMPTMAIYAHELFETYEVERIIRFGSAGGYDNKLNLYDLIVVKEAFTDGNFGWGYSMEEGQNAIPTKELHDSLLEIARGIDTEFSVYDDITHTSPWFYRTSNKVNVSEMIKNEITNVSMESYALFAVANALGKESATILTISDHLQKMEFTLASERETKFNDMLEIVAQMAEKYGE